MIQPGKYKARALPNTIEFGVATTLTEQVKVSFTLSETGQTVTWVGNFANEQAEDITLKAFIAMGWTGDSLTDPTGIGDVECELAIEHEPDRETGEPRMRVKWVNTLGGGGFKFKQAMDQGAVESLAERLRGKAMLLREKQGPAPAPTGRQAQRAPAGRAQTNRGDAWDGQGADPSGIPDF